MTDREWALASPYATALGIELTRLGDGAVELALPFLETNSNPGGALHGGCAASLAIVASQALTRDALGADALPLHTAGLQVSYLAAALQEPVVAAGRILRRGKNMCFCLVEVSTAAGKPISICAISFSDLYERWATTARISSADGSRSAGVRSRCSAR